MTFPGRWRRKVCQVLWSVRLNTLINGALFALLSFLLSEVSPQNKPFHAHSPGPSSRELLFFSACLTVGSFCFDRLTENESFRPFRSFPANRVNNIACRGGGERRTQMERDSGSVGKRLHYAINSHSGIMACVVHVSGVPPPFRQRAKALQKISFDKFMQKSLLNRLERLIK